MFNLGNLFGKAEDFFAELGIASVFGGVAALYVFGVSRNVEQLGIIAAIASVPHFLSNSGNILSATAYEVIGAVAPFVAMQFQGVLSIENAFIYIGGAMIGGILGGSIATSSLF